MALSKNFYDKYQHKVLQDNEYAIGKDCNNFLNACKKEMQRIANDIGAKLVKFNKGYYEFYGFMEKNGKYAYFHYSNVSFRNKIELDNFNAMLCRSAENDKDYTGGENIECDMLSCEETLTKILNQ